jgi:hypothetical protein
MTITQGTTPAPAPFGFDGHGINDANGQRIAKVSSCDPYIYPHGQPVRNAEFDRLSNLFAAAPELLAGCKLALAAFEHNNAIDWNELEQAIRKAEGQL